MKRFVEESDYLNFMMSEIEMRIIIPHTKCNVCGDPLYSDENRDVFCLRCQVKKNA